MFDKQYIYLFIPYQWKAVNINWFNSLFRLDCILSYHFFSLVISAVLEFIIQKKPDAKPLQHSSCQIQIRTFHKALMGPMQLYRLLQVKNIDSTVAHTGFCVDLNRMPTRLICLVGADLWYSAICKQNKITPSCKKTWTQYQD